MVLAPSTGDLRENPKSCQILKHHGDFKNNIFGSFSFAFWLFSPWRHFSQLTSATKLRLQGIHRTPGAGAVTVAGWQAPQHWGPARSGAEGCDEQQEWGGTAKVKEGNRAGEKPEDLTGESRELGGSVEETLSASEAAGTVTVSSPTCENSKQIWLA